MRNVTDDAVNRVLAGKGDVAEARRVSQWLATAEGQVYLSARMDEDFAAMDVHLDGGVAVPHEKMWHGIEKHIARVRLRKRAIRGAALLLPVAACLAFLFYINMRVDLWGTSVYQDVYVAKGEHLQVVFQDGTRAYLYPNSRLSYPSDFTLKERKVYLQGEGYFVVAKNPHRPFVVDLGRASVRVTGTSFLVRAYAEQRHILVSLDEGKVQLLSGKQAYDLQPGEDMLFDKSTNTYTINKHHGESALIRWQERSFGFSNTPLTEVLRTLNLNYGTHFVVNDTAAYHYQYTFSVKKKPLEEILKMMEIISPVSFVRGDTVKVQMTYN